MINVTRYVTISLNVSELVDKPEKITIAPRTATLSEVIVTVKLSSSPTSKYNLVKHTYK